MTSTDTDFDWSQVKWRGPRMGRAKRCCYTGCRAEFEANSPRLIAVDNGGYGAEFCEACAARYWAFKMQAPPRF